VKRNLPNKHITLSLYLTPKRGNVALTSGAIRIILSQIIGGGGGCKTKCDLIRNFKIFIMVEMSLWGHAVVQIVEALCYKLKGRGFDSQCHWNFSLTYSFWQHYGPGVDSASNRNEYEEYFLGGKGGQCVGLTTLPPSCADCLKIWKPQPPRTLRAWNMPAVGLFYLHLETRFKALFF
jgi:hypothetical protein